MYIIFISSQECEKYIDYKYFLDNKIELFHLFYKII